MHAFTAIAGLDLWIFSKLNWFYMCTWWWLCWVFGLFMVQPKRKRNAQTSASFAFGAAALEPIGSQPRSQCLKDNQWTHTYTQSHSAADATLSFQAFHILPRGAPRSILLSSQSIWKKYLRIQNLISNLLPLSFRFAFCVSSSNW